MDTELSQGGTQLDGVIDGRRRSGSVLVFGGPI